MRRHLTAALIAMAATQAIAQTVDLAAQAQGKSAKVIMTQGATAKALQAVMGKEGMDRAKRILGPATTQTPGADKGGYVVASICKSHECSEYRVTFAFGKGQRVWASILEEDNITYFGNPPEDVQQLLQ